MKKLKMKKPLLDYIDEDVAYLIGLITARGEISDKSIIDLAPYLTGLYQPC